MLGALVAGGISLLSGLFGRGSAKKQAAKEEAAIRAANDAATASAEQTNKLTHARTDAAALVPVQTEKEQFQRSVITSKSLGSTAGNVDMAAFLAASEAGGFNPLTFLRSGALSLFATTTSQSTTDQTSETYTDDWSCTTGERAMDAALSGTYLPQLAPVIAQTKVPGIGEVLGNALTAGGNQWLADRNQQQQNDFQMQLLDRALKGSGSSGSYSGPRSGYVPQAFLSGSTRKNGGGELGSAAALSSAGPGSWITMPSGSVQPTSWLDKVNTTWDDLVASTDQFHRKSNEVLSNPWSSWVMKAPDWFTGADVKRKSSPPSAPGFSWRDFSKGADQVINRWLLP